MKEEVEEVRAMHLINQEDLNNIKAMLILSGVKIEDTRTLDLVISHYELYLSKGANCSLKDMQDTFTEVMSKYGQDIQPKN